MKKRIIIGLILFFVTSVGVFTFAMTGDGEVPPEDGNNLGGELSQPEGNNDPKEEDPGDGVPAVARVQAVVFVDTEAPVISLLGNTVETIHVGAAYTDAGVTAIDNVDGEVTDDIVVDGLPDTDVVGQYTITYNVIDAAGNDAIEVTRVVNVVDEEQPIIILNGNDVVKIQVYDDYIELGAEVIDNYDDDLIAILDGVVNTDIVGTYIVTYNVTDSNDNEALEVLHQLK